MCYSYTSFSSKGRLMNIPHLTPIKLTFMLLYCNLLIKKFLFLKLTKIPASPHNTFSKIHFLQSKSKGIQIFQELIEDKLK